MAVNQGSDQDHKDDNKKPVLNKYNSTDKYPTTLNQDFDRNLTIEKAKFEAQSSGSAAMHTPPSSISTPLPPIPAHSEDDAKPTIPQLTTSVTLPVVGNASINTNPSQSTPLAASKAKSKNEERKPMKRKKLPAMNMQATPSEVFHRNLVDAVSNVEDSDENEQYVYPYSGNNTDTSYHLNPSDTLHRTTSSLYRPQSTRSFAQQQQSYEQSPKKSFLGDFLRPMLFKSKSDSRAIMASRQDEENNAAPSSRPKLRNYVMDHSYSQFKVLSSDWSDGKSSPPHRSSRRKIYPHYDGGYTTDDEEAHLLTPSRRYKQTPAPKKSYSRIVKNVFICLFLAIAVLFICVVYLAKPLTEMTVDMGRVLSSDKELIFDLRISAINSNFWSVHVADADISVFAFSQVVPMSLNTTNADTRGVDPAEYLGGFYRFDEPLSFPSSFYSHDKVTAISQIRIKSPGADKSGNERWSRIIRYPYGLVVRGVLKYRPLPFASPYPQSVAICDVVRVDPTTGKVSEDPDQGYCLSYGHRS